jgi:hypothetical protein
MPAVSHFANVPFLPQMSQGIDSADQNATTGDLPLEREIAESAALQAPGVAKVVNSIGMSGNR